MIKSDIINHDYLHFLDLLMKLMFSHSSIFPITLRHTKINSITVKGQINWSAGSHAPCPPPSTHTPNEILL